MDTADRTGEQWLLDTLSAVSRTVGAAADEADLGQALPTELTAVPENSVAWIGHPGNSPGTIRVRTGSTALPERLTGVENSGTEQALRSETTSLLDAADCPEYVTLSEAGHVPAAEAAVVVPLPVLQGSGVLQLYTDGDVAHPDTAATFARVADTLATGFERVEAERGLTRERARLEALRSLVSHDLGNPINIAAGRLDLVRMDCESEHIGHVESALEEIESLADEGLLFVKAGRELGERSELDLAAIATECWELTEGSEANLEAAQLTVYAESERLRMLLNQLFENAVVHSAEPVTVTVGALADDQGFFVEDDGPGIPEKELEYVFDRGYTTVEERDGHGLALVEEIAGALNWRVEIAEAAGTRIEIRTETW